MRRVPVPAWLLLLLIAIAIGAGIYTAVLFSGNNNLKDDVERLQTGIRAARDAQREATEQLDISRSETKEAILELGTVSIDLENSQREVADLYRIAEDSRGATEAIGKSLEWIGEFIGTVDRINAERED